ncbi:MAG TPA: trypsin-like peptidase domain-containing protein [Planctomycetaceae bacterium]|jgi:S1-C subfamily serine protease|nr:trypsin-like peptidase domain-containing protein [Planctomycetaceae bacterium]
MATERPRPAFNGPSSGGTVNGWLVAILLIAFVALYLKLSGYWPQSLFDPGATPRDITPRGDLAEDEKSTIAIFKAVNGSVVHITTSELREDFRMNPVEIPQGSGSGFVWDNKGYIVTNYHVVRDARPRRGGRGGVIHVALANSATSYSAQFVGGSSSTDLAVLKINAPATELKPIPVGRSDDLQIGQKVFAIGSPFSLNQSFTTGIVSGLGREIQSEGGQTIKDVIQVNAAINPGNSGGPLLDSAGRLIGVTTAIVSPTGAFSGIGFAIPVDMVNSVVPRLIQSGSEEPPSIGISLFPDDVTSMLRNRGYIKQPGVLVKAVWPGSGAEAAGIVPTRRTEDGNIALGDLITAIDGKPVTEAKSVANAVGQKKSGDTIMLTVVRGGERHDVAVTLRPRPAAPDE